MKLNIWLILDGKRGHEKQIEDLAFCINKKITSDIEKIKKISLLKIIFNFLGIGNDPCSYLPRPDLIIAAGHQTHLDALQKKIRYGGKVIIIMKPTLPTFLFNLLIIPRHDSVFLKNNIFKTDGSVNKLINNKMQTKNKGLILIGGISKNFVWSNERVINLIEKIVNSNLKLNFVLATSRRTPDNFLALLKKQIKNKIKIYDHKKLPFDWLEHQIPKFEYSWVTQDSISMIYELMNSGSKLTCIDLETRNNKFKKLFNDLYSKKRINITNMRQQETIIDNSKKSSADKCADFILKKFF
jgi:mitochondrial fission protein ELM1